MASAWSSKYYGTIVPTVLNEIFVWLYEHWTSSSEGIYYDDTIVPNLFTHRTWNILVVVLMKRCFFLECNSYLSALENDVSFVLTVERINACWSNIDILSIVFDILSVGTILLFQFQIIVRLNGIALIQFVCPCNWIAPNHFRILVLIAFSDWLSIL